MRSAFVCLAMCVPIALSVLLAIPLPAAAADALPILVPEFAVERQVELREAGPVAAAWLREALTQSALSLHVVPDDAWLPGQAAEGLRVADPLSPAAAAALHKASGARLLAQGRIARRGGRYAVDIRVLALPTGQVRHSGTAWADNVRELQGAVQRVTAMVFDTGGDPDTVRDLAGDVPETSPGLDTAAPQTDPPATAAAPVGTVEPDARPPAPADDEPRSYAGGERPLDEAALRVILEQRFPDMVYIPAGPFIMGTDSLLGLHEVDANPWRRLPRGVRAEMLATEGPAHTVDLPGFLIDRHEVTHAQFRAFRPVHAYPAGHDDHPVTHVSWPDAVAYARSRGKRLPTEAEWEKAARGTDGRRWPWGNEFDATALSLDAAPVPVGMFAHGASVYGVQNMAGNVQEWTATTFAPYPGNRTPNPAYNGRYRVLRGTHWAGNGFLARTTARFRAEPGERGTRPSGAGYQYIGFRCARDLPPQSTLRRWMAEPVPELAAR